MNRRDRMKTGAMLAASAWAPVGFTIRRRGSLAATRRSESDIPAASIETRIHVA